MKFSAVVFNVWALPLAIAGCSATPPPDAARTVRFSCDNGPPLMVVFEGSSARVTPEGGETIALPQTPSGSGFEYATPRHSLRGKGDEVIWTVGRMAPIRCKAG